MRGACYSCLPCEDSQRWKVVGIGLRALAVRGKCFARDHVASRVYIVIHVIQLVIPGLSVRSPLHVQEGSSMQRHVRAYVCSPRRRLGLNTLVVVEHGPRSVCALAHLVSGCVSIMCLPCACAS